MTDAEPEAAFDVAPELFAAGGDGDRESDRLGADDRRHDGDRRQDGDRSSVPDRFSAPARYPDGDREPGDGWWR